MTKKIIIAIDGHSSCGKSTMARAMARNLRYSYIDTGAMYRAVTHYMLQNNVVADDANGIANGLTSMRIDFRFNSERNASDTYLNDQNVESDIRTMLVSKNVSHYAAIKQVRTAMVAQQQQMGQKGGVVLDGRDIGTVVFPEAELKIFMTASIEVRTQRRYDELKARGTDITVEQVRDNLIERDHIDSTREESPLRQAHDARVLDNSDMNPDQQLETALAWVRELL